MIAVHVISEVEMTKERGIDRLIEIMRILRSENGCPWDKKQSINSLKPYIVEEAFEVVEAIDQDKASLVDELGDLLLQIVFVSQIAGEQGDFQFDDVANAISDKLVRRHPHVFGDATVKDAEEVLANWNKIKKEKEAKKYLLDGIPTAMPSVLLAQRYADRAASVGFDWQKWQDVLPKVEEEMQELHEAVASGNKDEIFHEMGDVLFVIVNLARKLGVNAEDSLRACSLRFKKRFDTMEEIDQNITAGTMSLDEMEEVYQKAKRKLRGENIDCIP